MADHTSAEIFGNLFYELAENPDERNRALALKAWGWTMCYDFSHCQMGCDPALRALGLLRHNADGEFVYMGEDAFDGLPPHPLAGVRLTEGSEEE